MDAAHTTMEIDLAMMRLALEAAQQAYELDEVPVGAVVHRRGEVLAVAHNRREIDHDPTAHAEMLAMKAAAAVLQSWRLDECELVVTLEPCPMCAGGLVNARIKRLVYGAADPKMGSVQSLHTLCTDARFNHRLVVEAGVLAEECGQILRDFFRAKRAR